MKIQTGRNNTSYHFNSYLVYLGIDLFAGAGCFAYIGRPYQNFSESNRPGYSDVDFAAIVADYPFYPFGR